MSAEGLSEEQHRLVDDLNGQFAQIIHGQEPTRRHPVRHVGDDPVQVVGMRGHTALRGKAVLITRLLRAKRASASPP